MERIAIILRKSLAVNIFREVILSAFEDHTINEILICSGFFQDRTNYQASQCFAARAPKNLIQQRQITIVGLYSALWRADYDSFIRGMQSIHHPGGFSSSVQKRKIKGDKWHAKIFIASKNKVPVLGIIGSSNITSRAFGRNKSNLWNYEADVILWNGADVPTNQLVSACLGGMEEGASFVVVSDYASNDSLNNNFTLEERLAELVAEIMKSSVEVEG